VELPSPRRVLLSLLIFAVLYAALLAVWFKTSERYAGVVSWTATRAAFPIAGVSGSVSSVKAPVVSLVYVLPDVRTGGWARVRQRLLNFPDLPLAIAGGLALYFLAWKRRLLATALTVLVLFLSHVGLVTYSAKRLGDLLARPEITAVQLNDLLPDTAEAMNEYGDVSPVLVFAVLGTAAAVLSRRRASGPVRRDEPTSVKE